MKLKAFKEKNLVDAVKDLMEQLNIPVNYLTDNPSTAEEILKDQYKPNDTFGLIDEVYFIGLMDDAAFQEKKSIALDQIKSDYDGIVLLGVTLKKRENNLLPTRSQLAEISRAFNRKFHYTPVVIVFKYEDEETEYIAFANTERLKYKQQWREGEKAGKVSLLRDIDIENPHRGHLDILNDLKINSEINSFGELYKHWQKVFDVNVLNDKFYKELSNWYFWAIKNVRFPGEPTQETAIEKGVDLDTLIQEHRARNVIRLLTRLLFIWFIKEKKLIPEQLFDLNTLQRDILNEISPVHEKNSLFDEANKESIYYKAILQNLFFATLNCPIEADESDQRQRQFRGDESYGKHRGIDWMMRYKKYFKNPEMFLELVNKIVPFLNGGLFECLDDKDNNIYIDGFTDNTKIQKQLIVPDYLFFGATEHVDLSADYGVKNKQVKQAAVKGLINILKSYKFTIAENTPIEEDVALDPELLGKVFENLLASYNPETKTTARKQTGSFYTPREIVNYMVDESLIAYLKNTIKAPSINEQELDKKLHQLVSFDQTNPFENHPEISNQIVKALGEVKIIDPAVGSGAFPMGTLQKMVHILQKIDPDNEQWKALQLEKAIHESEEAYSEIDDKNEREQRLLEINNAFDKQVNDPDFARKLYLIENAIYGVDIQPVATQIAKLRFFISLVVEQKVDREAKNFGIRPLPNLETKFVTANTLVGIQKDNTLFYTEQIQKLEKELKHIRHKLFGAKTKKTKQKLRKQDEELRNKIAEELKDLGLPGTEAQKLAKWDPYDQNASAPFFDPEWMFGIQDGFDIVIGNPPYIQLQKTLNEKQKYADIYKNLGYETFERTGDIYALFYERGIQLLHEGGFLTYITSNKWMRAGYGKSLRRFFAKYNPILLIDLGPGVFSSATVDTNILLIQKTKPQQHRLKAVTLNKPIAQLKEEDFVTLTDLSEESWIILSPEEQKIKERIEKIGTPLRDWDISIYRGILTGYNGAFIIDGKTKDALIKKDPKSAEIIKPILRGRDIKRYKAQFADLWLIATFPALKLNIDNYPAVKEYLEQFLPKIKQTGETFINSEGKKEKTRKKTGNKWFETQDQISYYQEFEKEKIVYSEIVRSAQFFYDSKGYFAEATSFLLTGENVKYLTSLLNSRPVTYFFKNFYAGGGLGDEGFRYKKVFLINLPIPHTLEPQQKPFKTLVDYILFLKSQDNDKQSFYFEQIIDGMVYELYFEKEIKQAGCEILKYLQDLPEITDEMSKEEKQKIIDKVFEELHSEHHPVQKNLKMMKEKVKEVKIIEESLKK